MSEVGIAVIGLGFVGGKAHVPSVRRIPGTKLIAVSDVRPERGQKFVEKYGCRYYENHLDAINDSEVDAVIIAVPTPFHFQVAADAIKQGKHVLCEMPLTTSEEESIALGNLARESGVILMPVLNFRFTPNYVKVKELLDERKLSCPLSFTFKEFIPAKDLAKQWPLSSWAWDLEKSGGYPNYTLSVWSIDLIQWLFGSEIDEVNWQSIYSPIDGINDYKGYHTVGSVKLTNGVVGSFHYGSTVAEGLGTSQLEIFGCNGVTLKATWNDQLELRGSDEKPEHWTFKVKGARVWGHLQTDQHFVDCILGNDRPQFGVTDAIKIQRIAKQMVHSSSNVGN